MTGANPLCTDRVFFASVKFAREYCSNRAILALYAGDQDTAEVYELLTRLVEDVEDEMTAQLFTP